MGVTRKGVQLRHVEVGFLLNYGKNRSNNTGSGRNNTWLSVVGRAQECLTCDGQQFEHFN